MKLYRRTWAEVDLNKLGGNYLAYRSRLPENIDIMCVVKAFCYGHGDRACMGYLQDKLGVKWFAVSNLDEAERLRRLGVTGEILILGYTDPADADELIDNNIIQAIVSEEYAQKLSESAGSRKVRCHIAADTGMTRIGVRGTAEEIAEAFGRIAALAGLDVCGAFTHYAVADTLTDDCINYTLTQAELLYRAADIARQNGVKLETVHSLNSAGGLYRCDGRSALARLGIILYGLTPDAGLTLPDEIQPVMSLRSVVSRVETVPAGVSVSYGRTFTSTDTTKIATVSCGYADGYPRALSNKGEVLIRGRRHRIIGRVCMDQFMVDVTGSDVRAGDTVTLIGTDGSETITADDIAELTGTIGYEVVCGISERVPRAAYENGELTGVYKL